MGAWGHGSFDNDIALHWVDELDESDDHRLVLDTLAAVTVLSVDGYLAADVACEALAAAEVVAASRGRALPSAPPAVAAFVARHPQILGSRAATAARPAVERILASSALRERWSESAQVGAWTAELTDLLDRLR